MSGRVIVVGSVNVDQVITVDQMPAARRDRHRRPVRAASRRQGRQPGRRGRPARGRGRLRRCGRRPTTSAGARARRSPPKASTCPRLVELDDEPTGVALILVDRDGENRIAVAGGANMALDSVQVRDALKRLALTREDVVLVGHEIRTGATHEALRLGRIAGATTILNPAPAGGLAAPDPRPGRHPHAEPRRARRRWPAPRASPASSPRRLLGTAAGRSGRPRQPRRRRGPARARRPARPRSRPRPWRPSTPWAPATR